MNKRKKLLKRIIDASLVSRHYFEYDLLNIIIDVKSYKKRKELFKYFNWFVQYSDLDDLYVILSILNVKICWKMVVDNLCIN